MSERKKIQILFKNKFSFVEKSLEKMHAKEKKRIFRNLWASEREKSIWEEVIAIYDDRRKCRKNVSLW